MLNMELSRFDMVAGIIILILIAISVYNHWKIDNSEYGRPHGLGVKELIEEVKSELVKTEQSRIAANQTSLFELKDFDLEIKFVVSERRTESGKIEYKVVTVGGETVLNTEKVQTIRLHMTAVAPKSGQVPAIPPPVTGDGGGIVTHGSPPPNAEDKQK
jgi:Trypsin-co-occurring domain 2